MTDRAAELPGAGTGPAGATRRFSPPAPVRDPLLLVAAVLGFSSIATLFLYFFGITELARSVWLLLVPAVVLLAALTLWARNTGRAELYDRILAGLFAGVVGDLAYDLVRVPIAHSGVPVFRAISFFGTVILARPAPSLDTEIVGWMYHLSNGIGFGLVYATLFTRPRWWTAIVWGVVLELAMLYTPYAEVFGYQRTAAFFGITMGAHVCYGLGLWAALRWWTDGQPYGASPPHSWRTIAGVCVLAAVGTTGIAADAAVGRDPTTPPSPPAYIGAHLYTTWDLLEPDRVTAMWVLLRYVDPQARFYFVRPFSTTTGKAFGTLFDTPEAEIRRTGTRSATEVLLEQHHLRKDPRLEILGRMTHMWEIAPWSFKSEDKTVLSVSLKVMNATGGNCPRPAIHPCEDNVFQAIDAWYKAPEPSTDPYDK